MDIKYLQLEPAAYPADTDWQAMSAAERGCYHSLIVYLSCNDGTLLNDRSNLQNLCNTDEKTFEIFFKNYSHKFIIKNGKLKHKRVTRELNKAHKYLKQKSLAGKASGKARRTAVERPLNGRRTAEQLSKVKVSKVKKTIIYNDDKKCFEDIPPEKIQQWEGAFPAVDIVLDLKSAALWVADNPTKKKSQWGRFLTNWFRRTQERGGNRGKVPKKTTAEKREEYRRLHDGQA